MVAGMIQILGRFQKALLGRILGGLVGLRGLLALYRELGVLVGFDYDSAWHCVDT